MIDEIYYYDSSIIKITEAIKLNSGGYAINPIWEGDTLTVCTPFEKLKPIPLNRQVFNALGFESRGGKWTKDLDISVSCNIYEKGKGLCEIEVFFWGIQDKSFSIQLSYVHELQRLFKGLKIDIDWDKLLTVL